MELWIKEGFVLEVSVVLLVFSLVLVQKWALRDRKGSFPPGPFALPIIGHLHLLTRLPHQACARLSLKYGDLIGLWLGRQHCVVVSSPDLAKEFLSTHDKVFANRPPYEFIDGQHYGPENDLFFASYGTAWRKHRKICTLELFSAKRLQELEYVRQEEVGALLERIAEKSQGGAIAVDIGKCVGEMSTNVIFRLLYSRPRTTNDKKREGDIDLPQLIKEMELLSTPTFNEIIPWLGFLDFMKKRQWRHHHTLYDSVITNILTERKQAMMQNKAPKDDFLHALLSKKEAAESTADDDALTVIELKSILIGVISGSIHTTALTLEWAMAELLKNPHCITKLQREIDTELGKKKQINDADISKLSYLKSVVKEVLRLHPVAPLLIPRISSEECKVRNYTIPAGTHIFVNVWAIGRDERWWPNAAQFIPERFEGKDIDVKGKRFELLPFGGGRRICLGLPLALPILETTIANLVNRFDWELREGETCASLNMDEETGLSLGKHAPVVGVPKLRV